VSEWKPATGAQTTAEPEKGPGNLAESLPAPGPRAREVDPTECGPDGIALGQRQVSQPLEQLKE